MCNSNKKKSMNGMNDKIKKKNYTHSNLNVYQINDRDVSCCNYHIVPIG